MPEQFPLVTVDDELWPLDSTAILIPSSQLPEPYRQSIRLRYQQAITGESLAQALAIRMENVKKRLQRARAWLTECMQKKRVTEEGLV
mgnify:CR=1 FL=1